MQAIIREKNHAHPMIRDFSYKDFQQAMFQFMKTYVDSSEPVLVTVCVCSCGALPWEGARGELTLPFPWDREIWGLGLSLPSLQS